MGKAISTPLFNGKIWKKKEGILLQTSWRSSSFWGGVHLTSNTTGKDIRIIAIDIVSNGYQQDGMGLLQADFKINFNDGTSYNKQVYRYEQGSWSRHDRVTLPDEHQKKLLKSFQVTYGGKVVVQNSTTTVTKWYEKNEGEK